MSASTLVRHGNDAHTASKQRRLYTLPYLLLLPSLGLILLVNLYPFLSGFYYSFTNGSLLKPGQLVGLANYFKLWASPEFLHSLSFSALFALCNVLGSYLVGLGLALLLVREVPGRGFLRVALLIPWVVPSIVSIVTWRWMIQDQHGLVNTVLGFFRVGPIFFLGDAQWATFSVIMIKIWRSFPFMMVSLIAGLQTIDSNLYEAGRIDGAGRWQLFWHITMPQLRGITVVLWILMTIWSVNDFDTPWLLTEGGPSHATESLMILAYRYTFTRNSIGTGSAVAFMTLTLLMVLSIVMMRLQREKN